MPRYLIRNPAGKQREDALLEDPVLTLRFEGGWAVFEDADGICLAIPAGQGAHIERVDGPAEPAPQPG